MSTLALGLLLHMYQPPSQTADVLARIADESYRPLLRAIRARAGLRASLNLNAVTSEMLLTHGHRDVIDAIRALVDEGRIELTGSGKFHPILPLVPPNEARRQITLNADSHRLTFGNGYKPHGFFPPEMAYGATTATQIAASGHHWMLLSGVACPVPWTLERVHRIEHAPSLAVLFRDDILSNIISFRNTDAPDFIAKLRGLAHPRHPRYVVVAMDAETFGHHIPGWEEEFLGRLYDLIAAPPAVSARGRAARHLDTSFIHPVTLSEIVGQFPAAPPITPKPSSWSTTQWDLDNLDPYPLWKHIGNQVHELLWRHVDHVLGMHEQANRLAPDSEDTRQARWAVDRALHSDQFWWASRRPHWSVPLVHRGLQLQQDALVLAARAILRSAAPDDDKRAAEDRLASAHALSGRLLLLLSRD